MTQPLSLLNAQQYFNPSLTTTSRLVLVACSLKYSRQLDQIVSRDLNKYLLLPGQQCNRHSFLVTDYLLTCRIVWF